MSPEHSQGDRQEDIEATRPNPYRAEELRQLLAEQDDSQVGAEHSQPSSAEKLSPTDSAIDSLNNLMQGAEFARFEHLLAQHQSEPEAQIVQRNLAELKGVLIMPITAGMQDRADEIRRTLHEHIRATMSALNMLAVQNRDRLLGDEIVSNMQLLDNIARTLS